MSQFINFGPGGQDVTLGSQALSWDGGANLTAYGAITGTAGQLTIVRPTGWTHSGWCLIHQTQGTGAGQWEINWVDFNAQTTLYPLAYTYGTGAQVVTLSNSQLAYNNLTINGAVTTPAWNGTTGGIAAFLCRGTFTVNSSCSLSASGSNGGKVQTDNTGGGTGGFRGGNVTRPNGTDVYGYQGEGYSAAGTKSLSANTVGAAGSYFGGGCGGGHSANGSQGTQWEGTPYGNVGGTGGVAALTTSMIFGGGGGGGNGVTAGDTYIGGGGAGGGIVLIIANSIVVNGYIYSKGGNGGNCATSDPNARPTTAGGGGAGGSILLKARTATIGTNLVLASGGAGGDDESAWARVGGAGGAGRIHIDYYSGYTGTTTPTIDAAQDLTLKSQVYTSMV